MVEPQKMIVGPRKLMAEYRPYIVVGLGLASAMCNANCFTVSTWRLLINSVTMKSLKLFPRKVKMPLKIIRSRSIHLINQFIAKHADTTSLSNFIK